MYLISKRWTRPSTITKTAPINFETKCPDVSGMTFDNALSRKERVTRFLQVAKNLYCFNIGGVGVKIEFAEGGPPLQDTLTDYLIRQKSGL